MAVLVQALGQSRRVCLGRGRGPYRAELVSAVARL